MNIPNGMPGGNNIPNNFQNTPSADVPTPSTPMPDFDAQLDKIVNEQQSFMYLICFCVCVGIAAIGAAYVYYQKKIANGGEGTPAASTIMKKAALQSMAITMLLKAHRYVPKGITDDKMFANDRSNNSAAGGTNPFALKQEDELFASGGRVPSYNLAIIIGVDSSDTPSASDDAARLKDAFEADGSYHVAFFSSRGFRPSSTNLASVIKQIQDARRPWRSVVVYIASKLRLAPAEWLDVRKMLRGIEQPVSPSTTLTSPATEKAQNIEELARTQFVSQRHQPKFLMEFMTDDSTTDDETSWVDIGMLLKRLTTATSTGGSLLNPISLMLDGRFNATPDAVKESIAYMDRTEAASAGAAKAASVSSFNSEPSLRVPDELVSYLETLQLDTAVERLFSYHQLECTAFGGTRYLPADIGLKVKKNKSIPLGAASGKSIALDAQTSMFVRSFLEGMEGGSAGEKGTKGVGLENLKVNWDALQKNAGASTGSIAVPVSTSNTSASFYHRCTASPASIMHYFRNKGFSTKDGGKEAGTTTSTQWHHSLFAVNGTAAAITGDFNHGILEQSSLMPNRVPPVSLAEWKTPRAELHERVINSISDASEKWKPLQWVNICGPQGTGKTTLAKSLAWQPSLLRGFSTGVVWIDLNDFAPHKLTLRTETLPVGPAAAGIAPSLFSAPSVFTEIVDVISAHFWPIVGGVNNFETATSVWEKIITGSNSVIVFDNLDRNNSLHLEIFAHLERSAAEKRPPQGETYPQTAQPRCGLFTCVAITITKASINEDDAAKTSNFTLDSHNFGPDNCESVIRDLTDNSEFSENEEIGLSPKALSDFCSSVASGNLWVTNLVAGIASQLQSKVAASDATSAKLHSKTLTDAIATYHTGSQGEEETATFINELVDLAISVAAKMSGGSVEFEDIANILRQHMVASLLTGSIAVPIAALKQQISSWSERLVLPALVSLGVIDALESQRPRRAPISRQHVVSIQLNPLLYSSHLFQQRQGTDMLKKGLAAIQSACEAATWPPLFFSHGIQLFNRDNSFHATSVLLAQIATSKKESKRNEDVFSLPNINDRRQLLAAFGGNFGFLRALATRATNESALLLLLTNSVGSLIPKGVEQALKQLFAECPVRPKGMLDHELLSQLYLRIEEGDPARKMLFGASAPLDEKPKKKKKKNSDDEDDTEEKDTTTTTMTTEATQDGAFPFGPEDFNKFVFQDLRFETPVAKRRKLRFFQHDDDEDSDEEDEEDEEEEVGAISAEMLKMQPAFNEFAVLITGKETVRSSAVTTSCFIEGNLFIGYEDGHLEKRDPSTGKLLTAKPTGHGGRISNIVGFPPDADNDFWRLCTASYATKTIIMWTDTDLSDSEKVDTLSPPKESDPLFGEEIVTAKVNSQLIEPGVNVSLRQQEQMQYHRDIDAQRFRALYGDAGPDFFEPGLRRRLDKERSPTAVLLTFDSPDHGDSLAWNQLEVFGKYPEEVTGAAVITLGSHANPLRHCNIGPGTDDGAARLFVTDAEGTLYFFRFVSYAVRDMATHIRRMPRPPAYVDRSVWVPSAVDDDGIQQKVVDEGLKPLAPLVDLSAK